MTNYENLKDNLTLLKTADFFYKTNYGINLNQRIAPCRTLDCSSCLCNDFDSCYDGWINWLEQEETND